MCRSYKIIYNDCRKPTRIQRFETSQLCQENSPKGKPKLEQVAILQKVKNRKLTGHSCKILTTRFEYYCGVYAHTKIATIPEVEILEGLSPNSCADLINSLSYQSRDHRSHALTMNTETVIRVVERGEITDHDSNVQCKGQTVKIGEELVENIVVLAQTKITIQEEEFLLTGDTIEGVSDHLILECKPSAGGCRSMEKTFIWSASQMDICPLKKVRELQVSSEEDYWVDEASLVLLKKLGPTAAPDGCPNIILHSTEYEDIYITHDKTAFPGLQGKMKITTFVKSRDDFILYEAEKRTNHLKHTINIKVCPTKYGNTDGEITRLSKNQFSIRSGEITFVFDCPERQDTIRTAKNCYEDIPIGEEGSSSFVTPVTRIYTTHSKKKPCNVKFPSTVKAVEKWIEMRPDPTPVSAPAKPSNSYSEDEHHLDVARGGLYTEEEVKAWEDHLEQQNYHKSVLHQLTEGVWREENTEGGGYILDNLLRPEIPQLTWWDDVTKTLERHTVLLCVIVLMIQTMKLITTLVMLSTALLREGVAGLIAVAMLLMCPAQPLLKKIKKRAQKNRKVEEDLEMERLSPL